MGEYFLSFAAYFLKNILYVQDRNTALHLKYNGWPKLSSSKKGERKKEKKSDSDT